MVSMPNVYAAEAIPTAAWAEIEELLKSGDLFRYTSGSKSPVYRLEAEFAAHMGTAYALAVNSCSSAIFLSLKALGVEAGSRILVPAFTFAAVPSAIVHADCEPVLVNIGENLRLDMADFRKKLDDTIKAVVISHMRGHTSDMDTIMALCDEAGIPVIEDAAHSLGTTWGGKKIGTMGRTGCFSFQSYKMVNAGEGGILVTDDPDIIARAVIMSGAYESNWKKHPAVCDRFEVWQNKLPLYNFRLNNLSAVVACAQIPELERRVSQGLKNHDHLAKRLDAEPWFKVPAPLGPECRAPDSLQFQVIGLEGEAALKEFSQRAAMSGVEVQLFGLSENNARAFWNWEFITQQDDLQPTRSILEMTCDVRLPVHLSVSDLDVIADALIAAANAVASEVRISQGGNPKQRAATK